MKILIDFGEPMPDHKLVARLLQHEHESGWAIFTDGDSKKAVSVIVRDLFSTAVSDQRYRDAEAERTVEVSDEA